MKGLQRAMKRGPKATRPIVTQLLKVRNRTVSMDGTAIGFGTTVLGSLPAGNILFLGAVGYVTMTEASADIADTFSGNFAVGTAPTADSTLAAGDVDIIPSTAIGPAVSGVTPRTRATHTAAIAGTVYDNTASTLELNLNLLIADANIDATADILVDADLYITYVVLGDD